MMTRNFVIFWMCGVQSLSPVLSSNNLAIQYLYETNQNFAKDSRTNFVPLLSDRVKRDTSNANNSGSPSPSPPSDTTRVSDTTTANKIYSSDDNSSPDDQTLTDEFLKKQVFLNKTSAEKNVKTHNEYSFDNDTLHKYYIHTIEQDKDYFFDLDHHNSSGPNQGRVKEHNMLSQSYRRAATINLSFKFPFYGHPVENITIATGGFLYTGDYVHSWLAATQYIAPLMANFDTSHNLQAKIRYLDDGDKLIVEWKDVFLQEKSTSGRDGPFTFQVILFKNGNITFAYKSIPIDITIITDEDHPVKVGLSDAYIIDRTVYFARRKTIYEYHRFNMKDKNIRDKTAILFQSLPTCNINTDCGTCLIHYDYEYDDNEDGPGQKLQCSWCEALQTCSDGTDRRRQDWLKHKCDTYNVSHIQYCSASRGQSFSRDPNNYGFDGASHSQISHSPDYHDYQDTHTGPAQVHTSSIVVSLFVTLLVFTFLGWLGYAYFNPNTSSGRFLIKYRPGAWRWRQSGARYTAASIHM